MSCWVLLLCCGCSSVQEREEWEARYRDQRDEIASLRSEVKQLNKQLALKEKEGDDLRIQIASTGRVALTREQASMLYRVKGIQIKKLLSGGIDRDGIPGDDGLSVLITPYDEDGSLVKLAGGIELELLDLALPKDQQRIGHWSYSSEEVKQMWHAGFVGAGYLFELDWTTLPTHSQLLLHARMKPGDNRQFDVSQQLSVNLPDSSIQPVRSEDFPEVFEAAPPFNEEPVPTPPEQEGSFPTFSGPLEQESSLKQNEPESFPIPPEEVTSDSWKKTESPSTWK